MPTGFHAVPDWTFRENQGAAVAVADLDGNGAADLVVVTVDDPPGQNRGLYRVGRTLDADGVVTGGWTGWLDITDWFSWANQGCGAAVVAGGWTPWTDVPDWSPPIR